MLTERIVEPELLDVLPSDDPRALASRRDLKRINGIMRQSRHMAQLLRWCCPGRAPNQIVELGGGDGVFIIALARRLARQWPGLRIITVDRQSIITPATIAAVGRLGWTMEPVTADVFEFLKRRNPDSPAVFMANLFLHHFSRDGLRSLFQAIAPHARAFAACEPRRGPGGLVSSKLLWAIGCNDVSRHDAQVSVRAGFRDHEISPLFPDVARWNLLEGAGFPFTHCFAARRTANAEDS
ncbi:MAG TPA: hypothetical protein VFW28_13650 [Micropepsaceae bacterium]|nr:hypothetical protein [Micropepsaceae bacterium]